MTILGSSTRLLLSLTLFALTVSRAQALTFDFKTPDDVAVVANGYAASDSITLTLSTTLPTGTNLTVINNTSLSPISGTFSNLAQGQAVSLSFAGVTYDFVANYFGGSGNDLVLQWAKVRLAAWGSNYDGEVGIGNNTQHYWEIWRPQAVVTSGALNNKVITAQSMGVGHSLVLCSDGSLAAWGRNDYGQLGDGSTTMRTAPVAVNQSGVFNGKTVVSITSGGSHNLALCADGTLISWGHNNKGQLGDGTTNDRTTAVVVNQSGALAGKTIIAISAGYYHSLVLCSDGTLAAWGDNSDGQLGDGTTTDSSVPVGVTQTGVLKGKTIVAIAASTFHNTVLCSDGTLSTWGFNNVGQLGTGQIGTVTNPSSIMSKVPVLVKSGVLSSHKAKALTAGGGFAIVLCTDGVLAGWGAHESNQIGRASTVVASVPVNVTQTGVLSGKTVTQIAGGQFQTMALCDDGTLASWGSVNFGVLGNDDSNALSFDEPVLVNKLIFTSGERFFSAAAGSSSDHSMALIASPPSSAAVTWDGKPDFGSVPTASGLQTRTFTLTNVGSSTVNFNGSPLVQLGGAAPQDFEIIGTPSTSLSAGASTTVVIAFNPTAVGSRTASVTIPTDNGSQASVVFNIQGTGVLSTLLSQSITFTAPATAYVSQSPLTLSPTASSGLPVTLALSTGTTAPGAALAGNVLTFTGPGVVKVQATQLGDTSYKAATAVTVTITVKADPTSASGLTLIDLNQVYDGTAKAADTVPPGATITYKQGNVIVASPTNAGSYSVTATLSGVTKTGTLVIAKAPLYVTPENKRKFAGQPNPPLTFSYSGFAGTETSAVVTVPPTLSTTATTTSVGGIYPITAKGGTVANYAFVYQQGSMVVETFAGNYEALLRDASTLPNGKVAVTVSSNSTSFTGKLYIGTEASSISLSAPLVTDSLNEQASGTQSITLKSGTVYDVTITITLKGTMTSSVKRNTVTISTAGDGRRLLALASGKTIPYSGAHTAVMEPATTAGTGVPAGAGWATASISTAGVISLSGQLGDGTKFTASVSPDDLSNPGYRLFVQPYGTTRTDSFCGGAFSLVPHPTLANRRYLVAADLKWRKTALATDTTYRTSFGPVNTVLIIDPWLPPSGTNTLSVRLGLTNSSMGVSGTPTDSASQGNLATRIGLSTSNAVSVQQPVTVPANIPKWKVTTLNTGTGAFVGSFELVDGAVKRLVNFTGVLRQPASGVETVVGEGNYVLPPITAGNESTTGDLQFTRS